MTQQYKSSIIGAALRNEVLPKLSELIDAAGVKVAEQEFGGERDVFDIEDAQTQLLNELTSYLSRSNIDTENGRYPILAPHQLRSREYAADWFEVEADEPPTVRTEISPMGESPAAENSNLENLTPIGVIPSNEAPVSESSTIVEAPAPAAAVSTIVDTPAPIRTAYQVDRDTELHEVGVAQAAIYPLVRDALDKYSAELAEMYAPLRTNAQGESAYDLAAGTKAARRVLMVSLLSWLQTDPALASNGTEIAILEL